MMKLYLVSGSLDFLLKCLRTASTEFDVDRGGHQTVPSQKADFDRLVSEFSSVLVGEGEGKQALAWTWTPGRKVPAALVACNYVEARGMEKADVWLRGFLAKESPAQLVERAGGEPLFEATDHMPELYNADLDGVE
eukprot:TRINITY_DN938_c4_g2_i3.p2 TRINITY_DN938_c4_g2~~TRINITY_DN938_c4_g2_i3.p2  ORF type:complete len:136 (+),score=7.62 TRINITY_DN938_c4_g2_i3:411-818(+)